MTREKFREGRDCRTGGKEVKKMRAKERNTALEKWKRKKTWEETQRNTSKVMKGWM